MTFLFTNQPAEEVDYEVTLGPAGARLSSAAYCFIHYTLLVAYILQGGTLLTELVSASPPLASVTGGVWAGAAQLGAALLLAHDAADADVKAAVEAPAQLILSPREAVDQDGGESGCARIEETACVVERRAYADVQKERRLELTR
jgi:hypothetical protein